MTTTNACMAALATSAAHIATLARQQQAESDAKKVRR